MSKYWDLKQIMSQNKKIEDQVFDFEMDEEQDEYLMPIIKYYIEDFFSTVLDEKEWEENSDLINCCGDTAYNIIGAREIMEDEEQTEEEFLIKVSEIVYSACTLITQKLIPGTPVDWLDVDAASIGEGEGDLD